MKHTDDISTAVALLKQTLPEMNKRNIATTPENYAIWYEFVNGANVELTNAVNKLDNKQAAFTPEVLSTLYSEFIANAHESAVNQLSESVKEVIFDFLDKVTKEGHGLNEYAKTLSNFSSKVEGINDIADIKKLISHLLNETKKREDATQSMQSTLETMAIEMKKMRAEVSKLNSEATTDPLTKVNNRRAFDLEIENLVSTSTKNSKLNCLLMLNLDNFSVFNKKFGHTIGDKVLRFVATLIKNNIKGSDSVARFRDDQFCILLPETNFEGALIVAENVRDRLSKQTLSDSAEKIELGTVTASIGVAALIFGESAEDLIHKAERSMQSAKDAGRNKVIGDSSTIIRTEESTKTLI